MATPSLPRGGLTGLVQRLIEKAHGVKLKSVASAITFIVIGVVAITIKNVVFAGLSLTESILATIPTLILKGLLGYFYPRVRDPIIEWVPAGGKRLLAESLAYAFLQTTSFSLVVIFLIPAERLPKAILGTFITSVFMGKLVGIVIDKLTLLLTHVRALVFV